jgi:hypothetical protein
MKEREPLSRYARALLGALIALTIAVAFFAGRGLAPCLLFHRPWLTIVAVAFGCAVFGLPIALVGFVVGYFVRVKVTATPALLATVVLALLAFIVAVVTAPLDYCEPF